MESLEAADILATLGHPGRLAVFRLLARRAPAEVTATEIAEALTLKPNTFSVYANALQAAGLISRRREGRHVLYRLDLGRSGALIDYLVADCCRGRPDLCAPAAARALTAGQGGQTMPDRSYNVLFICTGNSARSIFAETLLRDLGEGKFTAYSAGTRPYSELNPLAIDVLRRNGHETDSLRAKTVREFQGADAPKLDFVFTVCDRAANEECPPWAGQPMTAHWGMPDPVKVDGTEAEKAYAFANTYAQMRRRILGFVALPFDTLDKISLQARLDALATPENDLTPTA